MRHRAVAVPAIAFEGLRAGDDGIHRGGMAADAVGLEDLVGLVGGADGDRVSLEGERKHILHAGVTFINKITDYVLVGQVAVGANRHAGVGGVVPVFILGIHHVTVVAGGGFVLQVGWRVRHPGEDAQRGEQDEHTDDKRQAFHYYPGSRMGTTTD